MFGQGKTDRIKRNAASASELALELAQDKRFRKRLLSAIKHSSEAGMRTGRGLGLKGSLRKFASDQALQAELRSARNDLQRAYERLEAKRRTHRLRRFTLLAGLASLAAFPQMRERAATVIASAPTHLRRLAGPARHVRTVSGGDSSGPRSLEDLTREELYTRAQEADVPGRSEMSKEELVEALRARS
jgi:hypothetical protein